MKIDMTERISIQAAETAVKFGFAASRTGKKYSVPAMLTVGG